MSNDADAQCRWLIAFLCSPDWMTAATRAVAQTATLRQFSHATSAAEFLSRPDAARLRPAVADAISLAIGKRHVPLATAWKLLALRPQDGGTGIRAVVDDAMGLIAGSDDACASEAHGRLHVWLDIADSQYGDSAEDFFATAEANWPDEPMVVPSLRAPVSLLRHGRWDLAHAELIKVTERNFGRRQRPIPPTILTPPSSREQCRQVIICFATDMLAMGHRWSGELAIAWRMLACDPTRPESFNVILPPLTRLLDESFASESEMALLRARLKIWWMAAEGHWTDSKVSIFRVAEVGTAHVLDDDQPELDEAFARMKAVAADPAPAGPSVIVMPKASSGDTKNMPTGWKDLRDVALPLVVACDVMRIRGMLYAEYPHARQAVDLLTRDLREGQPVRMRPSLLVGPPGSGKSRLVRRIAEMISAAAPAGSPPLYVFRHDAAGTHDGMFSGTPKGWSSAHPSTPARAILTSMTANPIVMVDEIEKAGAELRYTPGGAAVATLNLATTEVWNDKGGQKQEKTEWHRVVLWGKSAESLNEYLVKGKQIYVEGRLQTRQWDDKDGNKRYTTEIRGDRVVLLSSGGGGGGGGMGGGGGRAPSRTGSAPMDEPMGGEPGSELTDDDIPF